MTELNTDVPMWMQRRQESFIYQRPANTAQLVMGGFELGLRQREQAMRERRALMELQESQFKSERYLLDTEEKMMEMDDLRTIRQAQQQYMHGNTEIAPALTTFNGNRIWHTWKSNQALEIRQAQELTIFNEQVSKLDGFGIAAVRSVGDWNEKGIQPQHYQALGNEQKRVREETLKARYGTEVITVDGVKFLRNLGTGGLHAIPKDFSEGAPAIPILDDEGNVLGHGIQNSRGGVTQLRAPSAGKRHPLQNKLDGLRAELAGEEAAGHALKAKQLRAEIEVVTKAIDRDQTTPSQPGRSITPPRPVLRFDPETGTFK